MFSVGGVVASILVALCLLWVGVVNQVGFHHKGSALNLADISVTIGIYGFGFAGHSVFPNIYTSMREPSQFSAVLITRWPPLALFLRLDILFFKVSKMCDIVIYIYLVLQYYFLLLHIHRRSSMRLYDVWRLNPLSVHSKHAQTICCF